MERQPERGGILFLSQRIPYPPNKGDKIRSWHFFQHLSQHRAMHLGCFIDDPEDWVHAGEIERLCTSSCILPLSPKLGKLGSIVGFANGEALTLPYFRRRAMQAWVDETIRRHRPELIFVYSSAMAQYVRRMSHGDARLVLDMVDMDSQKWLQYAARKAWPISYVYQRESRLLHRFESDASRHFDMTLFVSPIEAELYRRLTPEVAPASVDYVSNGVDIAYFDPALASANPFETQLRTIVFTGTMDYWPNVDAVAWFADAIWPRVYAADPTSRFVIVGANPAPQVRDLAKRDGITVTGRVPDVRPYLAHAAVAVAPLRVAQGVQNKVLEAMSMARPLVATPQALEGIDVEPGRDLAVESAVEDFAAAVTRFLARQQDDGLGASNRTFVKRHYSWGENLWRLSKACGFGADEEVGSGDAAHVRPAIRTLP
jgi:sugar transferase (PEP-CTERM/EpsH1 system associated)